MSDWQALWQSQSPKEPAMSLDEIRARAQRLEHVVSRRNRREYLAAAVGIAGFLRILWLGPTTMIRVGAVLTIAGGLLVVYLIRRWGTATAFPDDLALKSAIDFHRVGLERQRDLLRRVWWWYVMPFVPGLTVLQIGQAVAHPERMQRLIVIAMGMVVLMAGVYGLNRRAATKLQHRIDALNGNT
jgi:hypothetical protein